jgi:hypothetical protein
MSDRVQRLGRLFLLGIEEKFTKLITKIRKYLEGLRGKINNDPTGNNQINSPKKIQIRLFKFT